MSDPQRRSKTHTHTGEAKTQKQVLADVRENERRARSVHATKKRQVAATGSRDGTAASRLAPAHPTQRTVTSTGVDMSDRQPRSTHQKNEPNK